MRLKSINPRTLSNKKQHLSWSRKSAYSLFVLMGAMILTPLHITQTMTIEAKAEPEVVRFNRRFIQINDYLFDGIEDTTAIAHIVFKPQSSHV